MKKLLLTSCLLTSCLLSQAQAPAIQWEKSFGGTGIDIPASVRQTTDGGYVVVGETTSNDGDVTGNNGTSDMWVAKMDASGTLQWQKALGGSGDDRGYSIAQTTDGGYIVAGASNSTNGDVSGGKGMNDFWVVKLTSTGTITWQKMLGGTNLDEAKSVEQTSDGGYIVAGWARSNNIDITVNNGVSDFWVVKLDGLGAITWQKSLGGSGDDIAQSVKQTADGGYIVAGETNSNNGDVSGSNGGVDYWAVKLNSTGTTIQWQKCYGGTAADKAKSIQQTAEGGYILAGTAASTNGNITTNNGLENPWIVKVSATGTIEWQKCYGGNFYDAANSIYQTNDGGYIFTGNVSSNSIDVSGNHGGDDVWAVKLNNLGTLQWQKCLGGTGSDIAYSVRQTADNGYVIAGKSNSANGDRAVAKGLADFWVVKLVGVASPTNPPIPTGIQDQTSTTDNLLIYPNPSKGEFKIFNSSLLAATEALQVNIINTLGQIIYKNSITQSELTVSLPNETARGIYFIKVMSATGETITSKKIMLE